jgi:hypothetical protein
MTQRRDLALCSSILAPHVRRRRARAGLTTQADKHVQNMVHALHGVCAVFNLGNTYHVTMIV